MDEGDPAGDDRDGTVGPYSGADESAVAGGGTHDSAMDDTVPIAIAGSERTERDGFAMARRLLLVVAVLTVVGAIVALVLVDRLGDRYTTALDITSESATVAAESAAAAGDLAANLSDLAGTADEGLGQAAAIVEMSASAVGDIGEAMGTNIADGVDGTASVADGLASFIETVERFIPGNNSDSLAENLRQLADGLAPVPDQLRSLGDQLQTMSVSLEAAVTTVEDLQTQVAELQVGIDQAGVAIGEVEETAADLAVRADEALDGASTDLWLIRILVVLVAVGIVAACFAGRRAIEAMEHARS